LDSPLITGPDAPPPEVARAWATSSKRGTTSFAPDSPAGKAARAWAAQRPPLELEGINGSIVWRRYGTEYRAADVHGWVLSHRKRDPIWTLRAIVCKVDAFNLRQRPLVFVVPFLTRQKTPGAWFWTVLEFDIRGETLTGAVEFSTRRLHEKR